MTAPSIQLSNVSVTVKGQRLLAPVSLDLAAGQWHGIAGPNGGGKSTLLKAIAGLHDHRGQIALHWPSKRQTVGYMPQLAPFDASLPVTVLDFLRMHCDSVAVWRRFKGHSQVTRIVKQVDIQTLLNKRIGTLSSGERQRVLLACALMNDPSMLLLDEPLAGVDKAGREQIIELLSAFHQDGGTLLMIEHDWNILQSHCDTLSWIDGALQHHGEPNDVLSQINTTGVGLRHAG